MPLLSVIGGPPLWTVLDRSTELPTTYIVVQTLAEGSDLCRAKSGENKRKVCAHGGDGDINDCDYESIIRGIRMSRR